MGSKYLDITKTLISKIHNQWGTDITIKTEYGSIVINPRGQSIYVDGISNAEDKVYSAWFDIIVNPNPLQPKKGIELGRVTVKTSNAESAGMIEDIEAINNHIQLALIANEVVEVIAKDKKVIFERFESTVLAELSH